MSLSFDIAAALQSAVALHQTGNFQQAEDAYKQILLHAPNNPDALNLLGLIEQAASRNAEAVQYFRRALRSAPNMPTAHFNLGVTLAAMGHMADAANAYNDAIKIKPDYADAWLNLGGLSYRNHEFDRAAEIFSQMAKLCPSDARAYRNWGCSLQEKKDFEAAIPVFQRAINLNPKDVDSMVRLASCSAAQKKYDAAIDAIQRAIQIDPRNGEHYSNLGNWLAELERYSEAIDAHNIACGLAPQRVEFLFNAANVHQAAQKFDEAVSIYRKAISLRPDFLSAYVNLGEALKILGRFDEAIEVLDIALKYQPQNTEAQINKVVALNSKSIERATYGNEHLALSSIEPALRILEGVLERDPANVEALSRRALLLNNKAKALNEIDSVENALSLFDTALKSSPIAPNEELGIRRNKALALLAVGRFAEGWPLYRFRDNGPGLAPKRQLSYQEWRGEPLAGKRLFLWTEQGLGDEVIYASMLKDVAARYPSTAILLECSSRLEQLFRRSFPEFKVVPRAQSSIAEIAQFKPDFQTSIADLGEFFRPNLESFPVHKGFLVPDLTEKQRLRSNYVQEAGGRRIIGVSWRSVNPESGKAKTASLRDLSPFLRREDCFFVSLQYGSTRDEIEKANHDLGLNLYHDDSVNPLASVDGFASQVAAMDLVISISNTTVHFAGALNVPVWTLVSKGRGTLWYFRLGQTVPWYPSMRIFRQSAPGDWADVAGQVAGELARLG
jgi:tetratricopeptide (TPR) repeat protein